MQHKYEINVIESAVCRKINENPHYIKFDNIWICLGVHYENLLIIEIRNSLQRSYLICISFAPRIKKKTEMQKKNHASYKIINHLKGKKKMNEKNEDENSLNNPPPYYVWTCRRSFVKITCSSYICYVPSTPIEKIHIKFRTINYYP